MNEREIGRLAGAMEAVEARLERIESVLDKHIEHDDLALTRISEQLSLARFLWLTVKALILTIVFVLAFKFGDIAGLWKTFK